MMSQVVQEARIRRGGCRRFRCKWVNLPYVYPPSERMIGLIKYTKDYHIFEAQDLHSQYYMHGTV